MKTKSSIIVNLFAGPGAGKSTLAAGIFSYLKNKDLNVELVREYAKDAVWEENFKILENQIYVFGKQLQRMNRLLGKVDLIITDAPLMNSILYYDGIYKDSLSNLIVDVVKNMNNMNYFVKRVKKFNPSGRMHNEEQSIELDDKVTELLRCYKMPYNIIPGKYDSIQNVSEDLIEILHRNRF